MRAYGPGLEQENILPGKPISFIVDATETAPAPLEVDVRSKDENKDFGVRKSPIIAEEDDGTHHVTYIPPPVGEPYEVRNSDE